MLRSLLAILVAAPLLAPAAASAQDKLTVLLDWFVNPDHAPLYIAQARGQFAKADLDVTFVAPADPSAPPRLVAAGQGDIAITYQPSLYQQADEGLPVSRIGTLVASPLNSLVVLEDGPVQSLADLKGATIGYSVGGFEDALLGRMLESVDLSLDDVTLVNVNFALSPALLSGQVDAVIGAFRNFELTQLKLEGRTGRAFLPEENGVPTYEELIFIAANDRLDDDSLSRFLDVVGEAARWQAVHPDEAEAMFFKAQPDIDDALNRQAFKDTLPKFAAEPKPLDRAKYETFATFMTDAGLVTDLPPLDTYATALD
ncbi:ABC transporter substrate-binding protein [Acuticoccus sp. MNP-M23]|uniref:ABC transporter substrate-binding protein n=1 Tax=Acuticoccus sp. MNP-M23 TaxID=3072793 RepID=UPI00281512BF|nr:ABC transporter substrate-binding protein [Acuticoccus sp. MNP-M23]WMS44768.1 ABC transporter substrate-binding protein [Acuticoccus sp. MNP-M23]